MQSNFHKYTNYFSSLTKAPISWRRFQRLFSTNFQSFLASENIFLDHLQLIVSLFSFILLIGTSNLNLLFLHSDALFIFSFYALFFTYNLLVLLSPISMYLCPTRSQDHYYFCTPWLIFGFSYARAPLLSYILAPLFCKEDHRAFHWQIWLLRQFWKQHSWYYDPRVDRRNINTTFSYLSLWTAASAESNFF